MPQHPSSNEAARSLVEFLEVGRAKMRQPMLGQPADRNTILRQLRCFSGEWTPWLPVGVFLINHVDGPILIDTGMSPKCIEPGYFPIQGFATKMLTQLDIEVGKDIVSQLRTHGIEPINLQAIILTHLHHDHAGGLEEILSIAPDIPVYIGASHWEAFGKHPMYAGFQGCAPNHWPKGFAPKLLEFKDASIGPWANSSSITKDGHIVAVQTSGHVKGHLSIVVSEYIDTQLQHTYLITGDATYSIDLLEREEPDGANDDPITALESIKTMKEFARDRDVIILPSHDLNTSKLLEEKVVYKVTDSKDRI